MESFDGLVSIVHLRAFKPLSIQFPAPGVYHQVLLILPDLEPSHLSRRGESGSQPIALRLDFEREVSANELNRMIIRNLDFLRDLHATTASPFNRTIFTKLHLGERHDMQRDPLIPAINPLEDFAEGQNDG